MLIDLIKQAGVVGAGGAGFPTHVKLDAEAEYFIINAAECEPLIETDKYFCRNFTEELIEGAMVIGEHLKAKHIVIGIKGKYEKEIAALRRVIKKKNAPIELFLMDTFYPAGDEQIMVEEITGRSVPERGIPLSVGAVVDNVGTVLNVYNASRNIPLTDKYLSITGAVEKPIVVNVALGIPILQCIDVANPTIEEFDVILGGPMMGKMLTEKDKILEQVVTKTTSNLLIIPKGHYLENRACKPMSHNLHIAKSACLQCKFCTLQCPRYKIGHDIQPHKVMRSIFLEKHVQDDETYERLYGQAMNCSECGVCEMYACPMELSPRKVNIHLKQKLREKKIDVPKNGHPEAREMNLSGKVATGRLIARLGLMAYAQNHADDGDHRLETDCVTLPMSQHIGKPAIPAVNAGDKVFKGDVIGKAAEGLSTCIHASIDGVVESVDENRVTIRKIK